MGLGVTRVASISSVVCALAGPAVGQTNDAERAAARELFLDAYTDQQASRFESALDKFKRSNAVFAAPTTQLRIAQCQAALGQLVAAAETYRGVVRTQLPANVSPAFVAARTQAASELSQLEPKSPPCVSHVTAKAEQNAQNIAGLNLRLDGQPMNVALVSVSRPVDPGSHVVTATVGRQPMARCPRRWRERFRENGHGQRRRPRA